MPPALVVPVVEASVPHEPAGAGEVLSITSSPATAAVVESFTVTVIVEVDVPFAWMLAGAADAVTT